MSTRQKLIYPLVGATLVLVFSVSDGFAKGGNGQTLRLKDGSCNSTTTMQQDQTRDRDRLRDRDQLRIQQQLQDRDQIKDRDQLRDRDRIHQ